MIGSNADFGMCEAATAPSAEPTKATHHQRHERPRVGAHPPVVGQRADRRTAGAGQLVGRQDLHRRGAGEREHQRRQLHQPPAADHRVDEPGEQPGERQQHVGPGRRVAHRTNPTAPSPGRPAPSPASADPGLRVTSTRASAGRPRPGLDSHLSLTARTGTRPGSTAGRPRIAGMRIVSLLPSTTEILFALGAGDDVVGVTFECDHPAEARSRHDRLDQRDARGADPGRDRRVRGRGDAPGRGPLPPRRGRAGRPRRRPRRHPGPLRGLRGRRLGRRRRARPPRLHRRGAHHRPAHARGGARLDRAPSGKATGTEARGRARWWRRCAPASTRSYAGSRAGPGRGCWCWSGPTRRSRRATGSRRWSTRAGGESVLGTAGREVVPGHLGRRPGRGAGGRRVRAVRLRAGAVPRARRAGRRRGRAARRTSRCGRSTPTRRSPGPGRGWSTASRRSPGSCTRTPSAPRRSPPGCADPGGTGTGSAGGQVGASRS